jgi:hypothetical protein
VSALMFLFQKAVRVIKHDRRGEVAGLSGLNATTYKSAT